MDVDGLELAVTIEAYDSYEECEASSKETLSYLLIWVHPSLIDMVKNDAKLCFSVPCEFFSIEKSKHIKMHFKTYQRPENHELMFFVVTLYKRFASDICQPKLYWQQTLYREKVLVNERTLLVM